MKIFIPKTSWVGNWTTFFKNAFIKEDVEVVMNTNDFTLNPFIRALKLQQVTKISNLEKQYSLKKFNRELLRQCIESKPDVFLLMNESYLFPSTIKNIKEKCKCLMVCVLADNPWDSIRYIADFPHSLKYYDLIYNGEPIYNVNIKNVAPNAKIKWNSGGFDPGFFFPVSDSMIEEMDYKKYSCELSFTGSAYGNKAEGAYRADVLSYLTDFNLKIWGDNNWPYRFKYLPSLEKSFQGTRLPYNDLRKLYKLSKINLNLPAPQVLSSFQPRIFEIAACKGFQIVDNRKLLRDYFSEDELVTFDSIDELREKIKYFLEHENERKEMTEKLYFKVVNNYTWQHWAKKVLQIINNPHDLE